MNDWRERGLELFHAGRYADALPYLERAVQQHPTDGRLYLCLGIACAVLKDMSRAQQYLLEAIRLRPQDPLAHYNWACLLQQQNRYQEAIAAYEQAVRLDPSLIAAKVAAEQLRRVLGYPVSAPRAPGGMPVVSPLPTGLSENRGQIYSVIGLVLALLSLCFCPLFGILGMILGAVGISKGDRGFGTFVFVLNIVLMLIGLALIQRLFLNL